ncbi:NUDIX domain-containing protein [Streptomyces sp. NPDC006692]|uniref:NUDIX domain-containing protein n=1 Tax=Streptomyces sp. NPDC006692 TaxID=3364758 RepID=UPI0036B54A47
MFSSWTSTIASSCCVAVIRGGQERDGGSPSGALSRKTYLQAAVREMWEETALCLPVGRLSPVVWTRQAIFSVDGQTFDQYEEYRLARVTADEVCEMNVSMEEARYGHHWWSTAELAATAEIVRPKKMASLLPDVPATVDLGRAPVYLGNFNEDTDPE